MTPHICHSPNTCPHDHDEELERPHDFPLGSNVCRRCGVTLLEYVYGANRYARCGGEQE